MPADAAAACRGGRRGIPRRPPEMPGRAGACQARRGMPGSAGAGRATNTKGGTPVALRAPGMPPGGSPSSFRLRSSAFLHFRGPAAGPWAGLRGGPVSGPAPGACRRPLARLPWGPVSSRFTRRRHCDDRSLGRLSRWSGGTGPRPEAGPMAPRHRRCIPARYPIASAPGWTAGSCAGEGSRPIRRTGGDEPIDRDGTRHRPLPQWEVCR